MSKLLGARPDAIQALMTLNIPCAHPQVLKESALVEAFNLKGAIEYNMKNCEAAREAMADAPPRTEQELDPVRAACRNIQPLLSPMSSVPGI